jgi:hypothetical protein
MARGCQRSVHSCQPARAALPTLTLLGSTTLTDDDHVVVTGRAVQRHCLALLALLAGERRGMGRDSIVAILWPDSDSHTGRHRLSVALHVLRQRLGHASIRSAGDALALDPTSWRVDVWSFEDAIAAGDFIAAEAACGGSFPYAARRFAAEAVDYLLKPYDADRFRQTVERGKGRVYPQRATGSDLIEHGNGRNRGGAGIGQEGRPHLSSLLVREGSRMIALPTDTIDWVESAANYLRIHAGGRSYFIRMKISHLEQLLDASVFARVHRTRIVNMSRVVALAPVSTGTYVLTLRDGTELPMSRMHSSVVLRAFYLGGDRFHR